MHRRPLLNNLRAYSEIQRAEVLKHPSFDIAEETRAIERFVDFVSRTPGCFDRATAEGHITGSALVTDKDFSHVLLTLHSKLNAWLQLGGHADGQADVEQVALREAFEEGGVPDLQLTGIEEWARRRADFAMVTGTTWVPFDLDVHRIPERKSDPEHLHYDVRYLVVADRAAKIAITDESHDLRWMPISEARKVTGERSMHRQFDKLEFLARFGRSGELPLKAFFMS